METKQRADNKIAIVAMGNSYRQDDSIGIKVATLCKGLQSEKLIVLNEGNNGISLLDFVQEINNVIVIDAVDYGAGPGDIRVFDYNELMEGSFNLVSSHTYDIFNFIKIFNPSIKIIGIQPKITDWGTDMSQEVEHSIPKAVDIVKKLVNDWRYDA